MLGPVPNRPTRPARSPGSTWWWVAGICALTGVVVFGVHVARSSRSPGAPLSPGVVAVQPSLEPGPEGAPPEGDRGWLTSLDAATAAARSAQRPLLAYFMDSGSECGSLESEVLSTPAFADFSQGYVRLRIDCSGESPQSAKAKAEYSVDTYPTLLVLSPSGGEVCRATGYRAGSDATTFLAGLGYGSVIEIAAEDAAGPWSLPDGTGFANDVVREAFAAVGTEARLRVVPYARAKNMAIQGEIAGCFSVSPEQGLEDAIALADEPLLEVHSDFLQNAARPLHVSDAGSLAGGTVVGIVIGYEYPESVTRLKGHGVVFDEAKDEEAIVRKLAGGRIDAGIINNNDIKRAEWVIAQAGARGRVERAFAGDVMGSYIGFSRKHPLGDLARRRFNEGYGMLRANGTWRRIASEWRTLVEKGTRAGE